MWLMVIGVIVLALAVAWTIASRRDQGVGRQDVAFDCLDDEVVWAEKTDETSIQLIARSALIHKMDWTGQLQGEPVSCDMVVRLEHLRRAGPTFNIANLPVQSQRWHLAHSLLGSNVSLTDQVIERVVTSESRLVNHPEVQRALQQLKSQRRHQGHSLLGPDVSLTDDATEQVLAGEPRSVEDPEVQRALREVMVLSTVLTRSKAELLSWLETAGARAGAELLFQFFPETDEAQRVARAWADTPSAELSARAALVLMEPTWLTRAARNHRTPRALRIEALEACVALRTQDLTETILFIASPADDLTTSDLTAPMLDALFRACEALDGELAGQTLAAVLDLTPVSRWDWGYGSLALHSVALASKRVVVAFNSGVLVVQRVAIKVIAEHHDRAALVRRLVSLLTGLDDWAALAVEGLRDYGDVSAVAGLKAYEVHHGEASMSGRLAAEAVRAIQQRTGGEVGGLSLASAHGELSLAAPASDPSKV